jgi:hypothetical protein
LSPSPVELTIIFYCHCFTETPGPRIYIPQEQGGPVTPPGTGFAFRRLLLLSGLQWRFSNPPPHEKDTIIPIYYCMIFVLNILSPHFAEYEKHGFKFETQMFEPSRQKNGIFFTVSVGILL